MSDLRDLLPALLTQGAFASLRIGVAGAVREVSGHVQALGDDYVLLSTPQGHSEVISFSEVLGFSVGQGKGQASQPAATTDRPTSTSAARVNGPTGVSPVDDPVNASRADISADASLVVEPATPVDEPATPVDGPVNASRADALPGDIPADASHLDEPADDLHADTSADASHLDEPADDLHAGTSADDQANTAANTLTETPAQAVNPIHLPRPTPSWQEARSASDPHAKSAVDAAQSVYLYAQKVREPERVLPHVSKLSRTAFEHEMPHLYLLASSLAIYAEQWDLAEQVLQDALEFEVTRAHLYLAFVKTQHGDHMEALRHLALLLTSSRSGLGDEQWDELAQEFKRSIIQLPRLALEKLYEPFEDPAGFPLRARFWESFFHRPDGVAIPTRESGQRQAIDAAEAQRRRGVVDRVVVDEGYGLVTPIDTARGKRAVFYLNEIHDADLTQAILRGWRGTLSYIDGYEVGKTGRRRVASDLKAEERLPAPQGPSAITAPTMQTERRRSTQRSAGKVPRIRDAKRLELEGDLAGAARLYTAIIDSSSAQRPSAIKELAWLHNRTGEWRAAISLLNTNASVFDSNDRALANLRLNILLKAKQFAAARDVISELRKTATVRQKVALIKNDAYCLIALEEYPKARQVLEHAIRRYPEDSALPLLLDQIDGDDRRDVDLASLQNIGAGLNRFALYYLENASLMGADERSKARGYFDADDFKLTMKSFEQIQGHRPHDRAQVMLTLAHMCWRDPLVAGGEEITDLMRRFFSLMAESRAVANADPDTVRTFALEAISLSRQEELHRELPTLFDTYLTRSFGASVERLRTCADGFVKNPTAWARFLEDLPFFEIRSPRLREVIEKQFIRAHPRSALAFQAPSDLAMMRDEQLAQRGITEQLSDAQPLTAARLHILEDILTDRGRDAPLELDKQRLKTLAECMASVQRCFSENDFSERLNAYDRTRLLLTDFTEDCVSAPTFLSLVHLRPFGEHALRSLGAGQDTFLSQSKSVVSVLDVLAGEAYSIDESGLLRITLQIEVEPGGPPIEDVAIEVSSDRDVEVAARPAPIPFLQPGRVRELRLQIRPSPTQVREGAFDLAGRLLYTSAGSELEVDFKLPIRLGAGRDFEVIANPYEAYSGGTVVQDPEMFYGRDDLLARIQAQIEKGGMGQCFVLYGQKRSGKSSVLEQLSRRLTDVVIPVKVTVGEIHPSDATFGFLNVCAAELVEALRDRGLPVPTIRTQGDLRFDSFKRLLREAIRGVKSVERGEPRVVLLVDEFTYIFGYVREGVVDASFMRQWKALMESKLVTAVVVGQDSMPRFKQEFPNEFGVTRDERLSYLSREAARALAEKPIFYDGKSRYRGRSLETLFRYTAGSPWYLQIMCDRLVQRLNAEKAPLVTESDVEAVALDLVSGQNRLGLEIFNPLISASAAIEELYPVEDYLDVLKAIAWHSNDKHGARLSDIALGDGRARAEDVIEDLVARDVVRRTEAGLHRVVVGLFEYWLRVNRPLAAEPPRSMRRG